MTGAGLGGGARRARPTATHALQAEIEQQRRWLADRINEEPVQILAHVTRILHSLAEDPGTPADTARDVDRAGRLTLEAGERLRRMARELRPPLLDDVGLGAALRQFAADFSAESGVEVEADTGQVSSSGDPAADLALLRVAQAALQKAGSSFASRARIELHTEGGRVRLRVAAAGAPPDPAAEPGPRLLEMRQRMRGVGGRLEVRRGEDGSTVVVASVRADHTIARPS